MFIKLNGPAELYELYKISDTDLKIKFDIIYSAIINNLNTKNIKETKLNDLIETYCDDLISEYQKNKHIDQKEKILETLMYLS